MKNQYSIDEILIAVDELNSLKKNKNKVIETSRLKKKPIMIFLITLLV